jgi:tetratricopeptide (TPR) repeat protein
MRCAAIVALGDPRSSDAGTWLDAVTWLRQELSELGFQVAVVDGEDVEGDLAAALEGVLPQDDVFLHISGRLVEQGVVRTADGRSVRLQTLGDVLGVHGGANVSLFAELAYGEEPSDPLLAAEHVAAVIGAVGARPRGYAMVAGVRAASAPIEGLALTRLFLGAARPARPDGVLLSSAIHEQVVRMPESLACAESFTFVRGLAAPSFAQSPSRAPPSQPLPSFESEPLPSFEFEPLPSFESLPRPAPPPAGPPPDRSLDERIEQATEAGQWRLAVELRRERLITLESVHSRVRELVAVARILQVNLDETEGALEALEEARDVDPTRFGVLQALRRGYERLGRWEEALEAIGALANLSLSPTDRAELLFAQARVALDHMQDRDRAFALLQGALENDRGHERALAAFDEICALRAQAFEVSASDREVAGAPRRLPDEELAGAPITAEAAADDEVAGDTDESEPVAPDDEVAGDTDESEPVAPDPADPAIHASAFAAHRREGRTDAAFLAALALEELGAADVDQQLLIDQFRSVAPIRPRGTMDASAWQLLRATGSDDALSGLFAAVARAAVATRLEQLVARKRLVALDPARRLEETSTASVARSFGWAARVLGVPCPALYVVDTVPGEIAAVRAHEPSTALGPSVLRGRSTKELAFLAGRHLTYYRPEHQVLIYFPTGEDLARLLAATIALGGAGASPAAGDRATLALRDRLERHLTPAERGVLEAASRRLGPGLLAAAPGTMPHEGASGAGSSDEVGASLGSWARSVELTAGRAGLLLCGDLATATALVRSESRRIAGLSSDDRRHDLIAFCSSPEHTELRARVVVLAPESVQPPHTAAKGAIELTEPYSP